MLFSAHRRDALNQSLAMNYRASHARSCALHVAQKYKVKRSVVIALVRQKCGVDLMAVTNDEDIAPAMDALAYLKLRGLDS